MPKILKIKPDCKIILSTVQHEKFSYTESFLFSELLLAVYVILIPSKIIGARQ